MAEPIKAGDVVQLKSGSPSMTVDSVLDDWGILSVLCSWFDGKTIQQTKFPATSVERVK